jgi:alpha-tubulin suppressor-like RCC1 family protein
MMSRSLGGRVVVFVTPVLAALSLIGTGCGRSHVSLAPDAGVEPPDASPPRPDGGLDGGPPIADAEPPPDAFVPDAPAGCADGDRCEGAGRCWDGECCQGCWDGAACRCGGGPRACGSGGDRCVICAPGERCEDGACAPSGAGGFYLTPVGSFLYTPDGRLYSAGDDRFSQQPVPRAMAVPFAFSRYEGGLRFVDVAASQFVTCAITDEGHLYCWGLNAYGELGQGLPPDVQTATPERVAPIGDELYHDVTAGDGHFCAIRDDDSLWCWGLNVDGQVGIGSATMSLATPRPVMPGTTWRRLGTGTGHHACAIQCDQTLWCWGNNRASQLGMPETTPTSREPVQVPGRWASAAGGVYHTCGIRADGSLWCWGATGDLVSVGGQLGLGDRVGRRRPTRVGDRDRWQAIAGGEHHSCGLLEVGDTINAFCWGSGVWGQLGLGSTSDALAPVRVRGGGGWETIATGWRHSCGVTAGDYRCWGQNGAGELGDGTTRARLQPTPIVTDP